MRKICPQPRNTALSPQLPSPPFPEAKGMRKGRGDRRAELLSAHRQASGQGREDGTGLDRGHLCLAGFSSFFPPLRVLTSGHQPSSVLRSPAMGTLGSDFLSSLPLHEYPPAFPLGADIQGITRILSGWVGSCPVIHSLDLFLCRACG